MTDVHLPELIANKFGGSRSDARRVLAMGGVRLDEELLSVEDMDLPAEELNGRTLRIGKRREAVLDHSDF